MTDASIAQSLAIGITMWELTTSAVKKSQLRKTTTTSLPSGHFQQKNTRRQATSCMLSSTLDQMGSSPGNSQSFTRCMTWLKTHGKSPTFTTTPNPALEKSCIIRSMLGFSAKEAIALNYSPVLNYSSVLNYSPVLKYSTVSCFNLVPLICFFKVIASLMT